MSKNMEENIRIINSLNAVEGFDPSAFLRKLQNEKGEEQLYLDVKYRKLWFRLKYPLGKITKRIIKLENDYAIIESRVYLDRNDNDESYISCAIAQRWRSEDDIYGKRYVETAETASVGRALADAGFGIQFSEPEGEKDINPVDSPITISNSTNNTVPIADESLPDNIHTTSTNKKEISESMPVEDIMNIMTVDDAKNLVVPMGFYKGKTLGELCIEKPSAINWYIDSYSGKNNILRAAAKILIDAAG
ncbi:hypothetical protein B5E58_12680 [Tyzzerella sp. An114]|uniref:hypothetical protein n=1 Tax=Tyzzerella sp. An114 TaxID=1965545 RepID=UPI000B44B87A|nr:hypothetical protein [Tyzzerella sp. An114]OUQ55211.1 hypothetical protein B5E58_12680 [Tyzzerella sp. An114]